VITDITNTIIADVVNIAPSLLLNLWIASKKKFEPTINSKTPIMMDATDSALPWPNGWFLSAGFDETFAPKITTIEVKLSDNVCQASAIIAIEPVIIPIQYFKPKRTVLITIEPIPST
jgi:hypothetical protein